MVEQITIGKKSAEMIALFIQNHGHQWSRFYDSHVRAVNVFDIHYEPSAEALRALNEVLNLLTEEEETHEGTHSRQQQSSD